MELLEFLRTEAEEAQGMLDIALTDLDDAVVSWQPAGTANSIAQLLAHVVTGQDQAVNVVLKSGASIFESGKWGAATGIPTNRREIWGKDWRLKIDGFKEYRRAVRASLDGYLGSLNLADLEREVSFAGRETNGWWLVRTIFINHILGHAGEISALKGLQGLKGLPF